MRFTFTGATLSAADRTIVRALIRERCSYLGANLDGIGGSFSQEAAVGDGAPLTCRIRYTITADRHANRATVEVIAPASADEMAAAL